jgi:hypothetical protein
MDFFNLSFDFMGNFRNGFIARGPEQIDITIRNEK